MKIEALIGDAMQESPDSLALTDGKRGITYGELSALVHAEAAFLSSTGGSRFALLARNGCGWVLSDLALHHSDQLNVPLPRNFTEQQLRHVIDDAGVDVLITDDIDRVTDIVPGLQLLGQSPASGLHVLRRSGALEAHPRLPGGTAKITYTSGSTATPKGVCLGNFALERTTAALAEMMQPLGLSRHLSLLPLSTLLENVAGIYAPLRLGATCIVPSEDLTGMSYSGVDTARFLDTLWQWEPESLILVPELLRLLISAVQSTRVLPFLRFIAVGGAAVSPTLIAEARSVGLPVYEGYGLSECASVVCINTPARSRDGSVGRPLSHIRIRCDERGEIHVKGASMLGYLGTPCEEPPDEIATGDTGSIDEEGYLYIRGRLRNMFISSFGRNVSPEWIERELTGESAIRHACVIGEARPFPVALIVPSRPDIELSRIHQAVNRANERLPDYAQVREWSAVPDTPSIENGLLTSNGRLRRHRLQNRYAELISQLSASAMRKAS